MERGSLWKPQQLAQASSQSSVGSGIAGLSAQPVTSPQGGLWLLPICPSWDFPAVATESSGNWKPIFGDFLITGTDGVQPQGCLEHHSSFGFSLR